MYPVGLSALCVSCSWSLQSPQLLTQFIKKMGNYRAAIRDRLSNYGCIKKALTTCKCNDRFVEYIYTTYLRPAGLDWRIRNAHEANGTNGDYESRCASR